VDLSEVLDSMDECPDVRYVGLRTSKTRHVAAQVEQKVGRLAHLMKIEVKQSRLGGFA
jgi:hypothetical protein